MTRSRDLANLADGTEFSAADHSKLDGIEASATADQTSAQIKAAVEAATDSNVFTDADHSKLDGIEASATADQTSAQIKAAVEAATDSNVFTDADHSKLNAIEASADVTDTTNVTAAGALMDSELTNLAAVKAINQSLVTTASPTFAGLSTTANVGIGTSAPSVPLTVAANSSGNNLRLSGRSSDGYAFLQYRNNADGVTNAEIGVSDAKNMQFYTNGSERMQISAAGELITKGGVSIDSGSSTGPEFSRDQPQNLKVKGASGSDAGITGYNAANAWCFQLYGGTSSYGFLDGNWAAYDIRKFPNGKLELNGNTTYYLQPETTSKLNNLQVGGIDFGTSGASAETLDSYEEGSWSPQITGYGQSSPYTQTYSTSSGNYTKIGNQVTAHFTVTLSSKGNMSGAYAMIFGLPYNHAGSPSGTGSFWGWTSLNSAISYAAVEMGSTATLGWINYIPAAGGSQASYMNTSMISNTTSFRGTLSYRTTA
jgi:hypothetical protein